MLIRFYPISDAFFIAGSPVPSWSSISKAVISFRLRGTNCTDIWNFWQTSEVYWDYSSDFRCYLSSRSSISCPFELYVISSCTSVGTELNANVNIKYLSLLSTLNILLLLVYSIDLCYNAVNSLIAFILYKELQFYLVLFLWRVSNIKSWWIK